MRNNIAVITVGGKNWEVAVDERFGIVFRAADDADWRFLEYYRAILAAEAVHDLTKHAEELSPVDITAESRDWLKIDLSTIAA